MSQPPPPHPPDPDQPHPPDPDQPPQPPSPHEPPPSPYEPPSASWVQPPPDEPGPSGWGQQHGPGQQWGQQPPYAPQVPYGQYGPPSAQRRGGTNVLAVLSLIAAFVFAPAGIVLGHLAKRQLRTSGEDGDQLATWGLILSYVVTALYVLACCGLLALMIWAGADGTTV